MRVVVIGAGIVGACVSFRLAQAGVEVVTVEAEWPAAGTSSQSFAWLNAFRKTPRAYFDLNCAGMREHAVLAAELSGHWLHLDGNLTVARDEASATELRATMARLRDWGYPIEEITPQDAAALEPPLRFVATDTIVHTPEEGWAEVTPLIAACLDAAARQHGADLQVGSPVTGFRRDRARLRAVQVGEGAAARWIEADRFVLCAGPQTETVARLARLDLSIDQVPGMLAYTAPLPTTLRHLCHTTGFHVRPDGGGRIVIGSENYDQRAATSDSPIMVAEALRWEAAQLLPVLRYGRLEARRYGVRPIPKDGLPMVGPVPGCENAYVVVSHSAVTIGPLYGRLVAAELTGTPQAVLSPFRPDRFGAVAGSTA